MDYPYENLTHERFQHLAQALLAAEFPNVQCLPVGQADGGRDVIQYRTRLTGDRETLVYQVKFFREPTKVTAKTLLSTLEDERPSFERLGREGVTQYIVVTNLRGTAYAKSGGIDTIQAWLNKNVQVPAFCIWRDDLSRRLEARIGIRWAYPELLVGHDLLRLLIEGVLEESKARRGAAVRAYLRDTYNQDSEVKFKQVDLQNRLLSLFVDLPISVRAERCTESDQIKFATLLHETWRSSTVEGRISGTRQPAPEWTSHDYAAPAIGAASFFLHEHVQEGLGKAVLEGGPGQGKSTITQYVCQIHRMRLLQEEEDLAEIPPAHKASPVRLPFRIDLRDLAAWMAGRDPFATGSSGEVLMAHRSLEGFLARMVTYRSGGSAFTIDDLLAVVGLSPVLVVFDGLDEVPDIELRPSVVSEITRGIERLNENSTSLQCIVTTRPTAFVNSPGLPPATYPHFSLDRVTNPVIDEYADRWIKAKRVSSREATEVRAILRQKLTQPHLRELARNPMQLAILLTLIHSRGPSLPDKRTALYDAYISLFFDREAEKSDVVREYRELLIDIHRFLGWRLHADAEGSRPAGGIREDELIRLLETYLKAEGHDPVLARRLFTGLVERVVAIVSRVQGTFEFEVQPLREYFAARHLYETAPYSPPGGESQGTKPDIFDSLCRNPYWLNVTRFFAGCFSKGELPGLVDRIEVLAADTKFQGSGVPQEVAVTLLSDWVFAQSPRSVETVASFVTEERSLRIALTLAQGLSQGSGPLALPERNGKEQLLSSAALIMQHGPRGGALWDLADVITFNGDREERLKIWRELLTAQRRPNWRLLFTLGQYWDVLRELELDELRNHIAAAGGLSVVAGPVLASRRRDVWTKSQQGRQEMEHAILNAHGPGLHASSLVHPLEILAYVLNRSHFTWLFHNFANGRVPVKILWEQWLGHPVDEAKLAASAARDARVAHVLNSLNGVTDLPGDQWIHSLRPWESLVTATNEAFGECWASQELAVIAAAVRNHDERGIKSNLNDASASLVQRVRYARLRSGNYSWWETQFGLAKTRQEIMFALLVFSCWASPKVMLKHLSRFDETLTSMSPSAFDFWLRSYEFCLGVTQTSRRDSWPTLMPMCPRAAAVFSRRIPLHLFSSLYDSSLAVSGQHGESVQRIVMDKAIALSASSSGPEQLRWLKVLKNQDALNVGHRSRHFSEREFTSSSRDFVLSSVSSFPLPVLAAAVRRTRRDLQGGIRSVARCAEEDGWFSVPTGRSGK